MVDINKEENERLEKLNEVFFYNIGYENVKETYNNTENLLEEHKDIEDPQSLNKWFMSYQIELRRKEIREKRRIIARKISKRIAVILIVLSMITAFVSISVEAFRVKVFNLIIETSQKFSTISHQEKNQINIQEDLPSEWKNYYYPTFLPEGYFLVSTSELNNTKFMNFGNDLNIKIVFIQSDLSSQAQIDSEGGKVMEVEINGNIGRIIEKEEITILSWNNNETGFIIQGNADKSTLMEFTSSLKKYN